MAPKRKRNPSPAKQVTIIRRRRIEDSSSDEEDESADIFASLMFDTSSSWERVARSNWQSQHVLEQQRGANMPSFTTHRAARNAEQSHAQQEVHEQQVEIADARATHRTRQVPAELNILEHQEDIVPPSTRTAAHRVKRSVAQLDIHDQARKARQVPVRRSPPAVSPIQPPSPKVHEQQSFQATASRTVEHISLASNTAVKQAFRSEPRRIPLISAPPDLPQASNSQGVHADRELHAPRRRRRSFKQGTRVLREIKKYQSSSNLLIPRRAFQRVVREVCIMLTNRAHFFESRALSAIQEASEMLLVNLLEDAWLCVLHAKRSTLMVRDIQLARRLTGI